MSPLLEDCKKILKYRKEAQSFGISTAYILVYSEAKRNTERAPYDSGKKKLGAKFCSWHKSLRKACDGKATVGYVGSVMREPQGQDEEQWSWGVALYRLDYEQDSRQRKRAA